MVVYSVAKITLPRRKKLTFSMQAMREVYKAMSKPGKPIFRGGSWRLPEHVANEHIARPFLELCRQHGVNAKHCRQDLLSTP